MHVEGKHSRSLHLEDSDESLALQDVADLAENALQQRDLIPTDSEVSAGWSEERRRRAEHIIGEIRRIE